MKELLSLLGNGNQLNFDKTDYYAGIIGESPSKGARSPVLWNAAFEGLGISCLMHPMDVEKHNLKEVITNLRNDNRFIGGAVAVPYKQAILPLLDQIEEEAELIGSINCIYRNGDKFIGTNTDGAGAMKSLQSILKTGTLHGKKILVLGIGGAGQAVATYAAKGVGFSGRVILVNRTAGNAKKLAEKLKNYCSVELSGFPVSNLILKEVDVLINCSSVGYEALCNDKFGLFTLHPYSPLGPIDESIRVASGDKERQRFIGKAEDSILQNIASNLKAFQFIKQRTIVFDIIYQPYKTTLLHLAECHGMLHLNGLKMNLEQAVIAFQKAANFLIVDGVTDEKVRKIMINVG